MPKPAPASAPPSDHDLVSRAGGGDEQAIGTLYDRYGGVLYAVAYRVVGQRADAEDVVIEAFAYQLWSIKDGKPVPSVTFRPEASGHARVERVPVPTDGKVSAAAITLEPAGGSSEPTSPILLVGPLQKS